MDGNLITFYILALVAIGSALAMVLNEHSVYSALFLVLNFGTVAVFYISLGAPFIAMAQITVYAGAIMVLFLFVIMLLGAEEIAGKDNITWQKPIAWILTFILLADAFYMLAFKQTSGLGSITPFEQFGDPKAIGLVLFNEYLLPFEITSILLLVAMVGAIILVKKDKDEFTE